MTQKTNSLRLGVNIDHVATLRNARGGVDPCPVRAAQMAAKSGADGITAHLREDRRHIKDRDIERLKAEVALPLNLEMAATAEMLAIALKTKPHAVCLVPEKRQEITTEGGLDIYRLKPELEKYVGELAQAGIRVSLFIDAETKQIETARELGAPVIELHTGTYAHSLFDNPDQLHINIKTHKYKSGVNQAYDQIVDAAILAENLGLECHAGHGLNYNNVVPIAAIPTIAELNIGHFIIGEAIFMGFNKVIRHMRGLMDGAR